MKKPIKKMPSAGTLGGVGSNANSNPYFSNIPENQNNYNPEVDWLDQTISADQREDAAKARGDQRAADIAEQERKYCGEMHNGTACTNNPYLYDADPNTWGMNEIY